MAMLSTSGRHFRLLGDVSVCAMSIFLQRGAPIWPGRVGHSSAFDRSPSTPQVHIMGFLALSPAQVTRGAPFWPGRVRHGSVFDRSPSTSQVRMWVSLRPCSCFYPACIDPTGGVPIWPGRARSVGLQPITLHLQGVYHYPGRCVGSHTLFERCAM